MHSESKHRPPHVIAEELARESDLDEATELATELAFSIEEEKKKLAQAASASTPQNTVIPVTRI